MAIKVIEYLIVGEAPNTAVHTFYDPVSANVDTEWTYIGLNGETTSGDAVQYALRYNNVTELAEVSEDVFVRRASSGAPDTYGTLPNLDPNVLGTALGGTGLATVGTAGQVLSVAANGVDLEYTTNGAGTGTVTSFSAGTTGFSVATATTTPTISGVLNLANGGTGAALADPGADRIAFWDDSAGAVTWLTAGTGLVITGTTLDSTAGAKQIITGSANSVTAGASRYFSLTNPGQSATGNQTSDPSDPATLVYEGATLAPVAGTMKNLRFRCREAGVGETITVTLMVNGVASTLTAQITGATETAADTTHSVSIAAGDLMSLRVTLSGGASQRPPSWGLEFDPS